MGANAGRQADFPEWHRQSVTEKIGLSGGFIPHQDR